MTTTLPTEGLSLDLIQTEQFYREILDQVADGIYIVDTERKVLYWNKAAETLTGYSEEQVLGFYCAQEFMLMHVDDDGNCLCYDDCPLVATMSDGEPKEANVYLHHHDGYRIPVHVHASPLRNHEGEIVGAVETFHDNTTLMDELERLHELKEAAYLDPLTNLANRRYLDESFESHFAEQKRHGRDFGVILADVDHFKLFNDTFGHQMGDTVLQMVAQTLAHNCRPYDVVGRWGGEEFLVLVAHADSNEIHQLAERLRVLISQSRLWENEHDFYVTVSLGATMVRPGDDTEHLIQRADTLMYESKTHGRNCVTFEE